MSTYSNAACDRQYLIDTAVAGIAEQLAAGEVTIGRAVALNVAGWDVDGETVRLSAADLQVAARLAREFTAMIERDREAERQRWQDQRTASGPPPFP
jgi:hypothetical protein